MVGFIVHLLVSAALLLFIGRLVSGLEFDTLGAALPAAFLLGLVDALVRPLRVMLTFRLTLLTLGVFLWVINALMLNAPAAVVPNFRLDGFVPALIGALLLRMFNVLRS